MSEMASINKMYRKIVSLFSALVISKDGWNTPEDTGIAW